MNKSSLLWIAVSAFTVLSPLHAEMGMTLGEFRKVCSGGKETPLSTLVNPAASDVRPYTAKFEVGDLKIVAAFPGGRLAMADITRKDGAPIGDKHMARLLAVFGRNAQWRTEPQGGSNWYVIDGDKTVCADSDLLGKRLSISNWGFVGGYTEG